MRRNERELIQLAETYVPYEMCIGGHLTHQTYCCLWCGSSDSKVICDKEKIRSSEYNLTDYQQLDFTNPIRKYRVVDKNLGLT